MVNRMNNSRVGSYNNGMTVRNRGPVMNDRASTCSDTVKHLKCKLQMVDFSLLDTVLYLNAYPHCPKAKARYNELLCERTAILEKLGEAGVPINNMSVTADGWNWTDGPWPWEYDANI